MTTRATITGMRPDVVAVTAIGYPEEPSKADLLAALNRLHVQFMAAFTELHERLDAMPDVPPRPGRSGVEPLPPSLDRNPMRGFLIDEPE